MTTDDTADTPSLILASAALLLRHRTFEDVSYLELAEAADVSERTIYRRFPTRSHLLDALGRWIEENHFPACEFRDVEQLRDAVRARFRAYDSLPALAIVTARAGAQIPTGDEAAPPLTVAVLALLRSLAPTLNRRDALRAAASIGYFASPMFWARMRTGFDMSADEIATTFNAALDATLPVTVRANRSS